MHKTLRHATSLKVQSLLFRKTLQLHCARVHRDTAQYVRLILKDGVTVQAIEMALAAAGAKAAKTIFCDDSVRNVTGAHSAGVFSVLVGLPTLHMIAHDWDTAVANWQYLSVFAVIPV